MSGSTGAASSCPPALDGATRGSPGARPSVAADAAFPRTPLVSRLEFGALPNAVPCARLHTRVILKEWGLGPVADDAEVVVSELITNALKASWSLNENQPVVLHLLADHGRLTIQVWDCLPAAPNPRPHATDAETGRGLEIVSLLSDQWGYYHPVGGGKIVWAALLREISTPGTAPGAGA